MKTRQMLWWLLWLLAGPLAFLFAFRVTCYFCDLITPGGAARLGWGLFVGLVALGVAWVLPVGFPFNDTWHRDRTNLRPLALLDAALLVAALLAQAFAPAAI